MVFDQVQENIYKVNVSDALAEENVAFDPSSRDHTAYLDLLNDRHTRGRTRLYEPDRTHAAVFKRMASTKTTPAEFLKEIRIPVVDGAGHMTFQVARDTKDAMRMMHNFQAFCAHVRADNPYEWLERITASLPVYFIQGIQGEGTVNYCTNFMFEATGAYRLCQNASINRGSVKLTLPTDNLTKMRVRANAVAQRVALDMVNCQRHLYFYTLFFISEEDRTGHAIPMFVDTRQRKVYLADPNGTEYAIGQMYYDTFETYVMPLYPFNQMILTPLHDTCPVHAAQAVGGLPACTVYASLFNIAYAMGQGEYTPYQLGEAFASFGRDRIRRLILRYSLLFHSMVPSYMDAHTGHRASAWLRRYAAHTFAEPPSRPELSMTAYVDNIYDRGDYDTLREMCRTQGFTDCDAATPEQLWYYMRGKANDEDGKKRSRISGRVYGPVDYSKYDDDKIREVAKELGYWTTLQSADRLRANLGQSILAQKIPDANGKSSTKKRRSGKRSSADKQNAGNSWIPPIARNARRVFGL